MFLWFWVFLFFGFLITGIVGFCLRASCPFSGVGSLRAVRFSCGVWSVLLRGLGSLSGFRCGDRVLCLGLVWWSLLFMVSVVWCGSCFVRGLFSSGCSGSSSGVCVVVCSWSLWAGFFGFSSVRGVRVGCSFVWSVVFSFFSGGCVVGHGWVVGVVHWFVFFSGSRVRAGLGWSGLRVGGGRRCRWSRRGRLVRNVGARVRAKRSYEEAGGLERGEPFARSPIRRTRLFDASVLVVGSRRGVRGEGSADLGAALPGPHPLPPKAQSRAAVPSSAPPTTSDAQWTPG